MEGAALSDLKCLSSAGADSAIVIIIYEFLIFLNSF